MHSFLCSAPPRVFDQALKVPYYSQADPTLVLDSFLRPGTFHSVGLSFSLSLDVTLIPLLFPKPGPHPSPSS
jgi:hypothetical protein